jgi:type VI secretion system protein ImpK
MLVLNPGGRRAVPAAGPADGAGPAHAVPPDSGLNPLVRAANPLLDLAVPLRYTLQPPDLNQLRERLAQAVRSFETEARDAGVPNESIAVARYALCTLLDEAIAGTAWGSGVWGSRSLLVAFHNEASGGEKFLPGPAAPEPGPGAPPRSSRTDVPVPGARPGRTVPGGRSGTGPADDTARAPAALIRQHRGEFETRLSPHWRGVAAPGASPLRATPVWVFAAVACALLLAAQLVARPYSTGLPIRYSPSCRHCARQAWRPGSGGADAARGAGAALRHRASWRRKWPRAGHGRRVRRAHHHHLARRGHVCSGSAELNEDTSKLLGRIGAALATLPGRVIVIGHTDNTVPGCRRAIRRTTTCRRRAR